MLAISLLVALDLWEPVVSVLTVSSPSMLLATVPVAAINEDGHALPREHDVWPNGATTVHAESLINPEPKTTSME